MKTEQLNNMIARIKTKLPYPHTKAARIEELKSILINEEGISNGFAIFIGREINKLNSISEYSYQGMVNATARLTELQNKSHTRSIQGIFKSINNDHLLSMSHKVDLLVTNIVTITQIPRPLISKDAEYLVTIIEQANISPLTMSGAIYGYWMLVLDKEHLVTIAEDKAKTMHEFAELLRIITESMVAGIVIESEKAIKSAFITASKRGQMDQKSVEYVLNTPSQIEFFRRMAVKAANNIYKG